jgi:photosystem II stability/assembly factor-like uncharacterized protein
MTFILIAIFIGNFNFMGEMSRPQVLIDRQGVIDNRISTLSNSINAFLQEGSNFFSFSTINKNNLWAIGEETKDQRHLRGVAFHSTDGGFSWKQNLSLAEEHFFDIQFINPQCGWIVGDNGLILKTTDGGASWERNHTSTKLLLMNVQFLSPQKGWVMSDWELLRTEDGGKTWLCYQSQKIGSAGYIFRSFSFGDERTGWFIEEDNEENGQEGRIFSTTDGGRSWRGRERELKDTIKKSPGYDRDFEKNILFEKVKFFDSQSGYVIARTYTEKGDSRLANLIILKTEDGGKKWTVLTRFNDSWLLRTQFVSQEEMWIHENNRHQLLHTINGGKTWNELSYPRGEGLSYTPLMFFLDSNKGWMAATPDSFLYPWLYTNNGGKTWSRHKLRFI